MQQEDLLQGLAPYTFPAHFKEDEGHGLCSSPPRRETQTRHWREVLERHLVGVLIHSVRSDKTGLHQQLLISHPLLPPALST